MAKPRLPDSPGPWSPLTTPSKNEHYTKPGMEVLYDAIESVGQVMFPPDCENPWTGNERKLKKTKWGVPLCEIEAAAEERWRELVKDARLALENESSDGRIGTFTPEQWRETQNLTGANLKSLASIASFEALPELSDAQLKALADGEELFEDVRKLKERRHAVERTCLDLLASGAVETFYKKGEKYYKFGPGKWDLHAGMIAVSTTYPGKYVDYNSLAVRDADRTIVPLLYESALAQAALGYAPVEFFEVIVTLKKRFDGEIETVPMIHAVYSKLLFEGVCDGGLSIATSGSAKGGSPLKIYPVTGDDLAATYGKAYAAWADGEPSPVFVAHLRNLRIDRSFVDKLQSMDLFPNSDGSEIQAENRALVAFDRALEQAVAAIGEIVEVSEIPDAITFMDAVDQLRLTEGWPGKRDSVIRRLFPLIKDGKFDGALWGWSMENNKYQVLTGSIVTSAYKVVYDAWANDNEIEPNRSDEFLFDCGFKLFRLELNRFKEVCLGVKPETQIVAPETDRPSGQASADTSADDVPELFRVADELADDPNTRGRATGQYQIYKNIRSVSTAAGELLPRNEFVRLVEAKGYAKPTVAGQVHKKLASRLRGAKS